MPERKKFYELINEAFHKLVDELTADHPELEGVAIAIVYAQEIGDPPGCLVIGDLNDPSQLCRTGTQVSKLQMMVAQGVADHFMQAEQFMARIKQERDAGENKEDDEESSP